MCGSQLTTTGPAMTQFASRFADLAVVTLIFSALIGG